MQYYDYHAKVQYSDLGEDARLSPTGALRLMQEAACEASAMAGFGPEDTKKQGFGWVLCGWKLQIHRRPFWGEALTVRTWPRTMALHTSDRDFILSDEKGERVISASSRWLLLDTTTGRVAKITDAVSSRYDLWEERALKEELPLNGRSPEDAVCTFTYTVLHRDIDTLHHMNNLHYLELAREALPPEVESQPFANIEILYKRQIKLGDTVHFLYSYTEGKHLVEIVNQDQSKTHTLLWFF